MTAGSARQQSTSSRRSRVPAMRIASYAVLVAWSAVVLFPLFWMVTTAFKRQSDLFPRRLYIPFLQFTPKLDAFDYVFTDFGPQLSNAFGNSLIAAGGSALIATGLGALAAHALVRQRYRIGPIRNEDIAFWFVSQRILPPVAVVFPFLIAFRAVGLADNAVGLMIVYTLFALPISIWIMRDAFRAVPQEIEESAYLDGLSRIGAFLRIGLPLATPGLVASLLITFILGWNEYVFALMLTFQSGQTLPVMVAAQATQQGNYFWNMAAMSMVAIVPVLVLGISLQRWLIRGLTFGGIR
jgi:multiple sugar transport system permease protein